MKNLGFFDALGIGFAWAGAGVITYFVRNDFSVSAIAIICVIGAYYTSKMIVIR